MTTLYFAIREQSWQNWSGLAAAEMKLNWTNSFLSDAWIEEFGNSSGFFLFFFFLNSFKCVNPACYILGSNFYIYGTVVIILLRKEKYKSIRINSCCRKSTALFTEVTIVNTRIQQYTTCFFHSSLVTQFFLIKKSLSVVASFCISKHLYSAKTAEKAYCEMLVCELIRVTHPGLQARASPNTLQNSTLWAA